MNAWPVQYENSPLLIAQARDEHTVTATTAVPEKAGQESEGAPPAWTFLPFAGIAFLLIITIAIIGTRRLKLVPRGLQNLLEMVFEGLYSLPEQVMGPRGRQYAPFVSTFFIYIVTMNALGLIPFFKAATASLSITLGLALVAFLGVQYFGFKAHGIKYLAHFIGPVPAMAILILPLEILSEFIRPVSLSVRLYGNIFGEEQVTAALANLIKIHGVPIPVVPLVILPLEVLTVFLQAFVFTLLVTVYIALATEKHEPEAGEEAHAH